VSRADALVARLRQASVELIATIAGIDSTTWSRVPSAGVWSVGKDAEHVAEGNVYHQWIVRMTLREKVSSNRPPLERAQLTTSLSVPEMVELLRKRTEESADLIGHLTDDQLDLPARPARPRASTLADVIEQVLIGHIDAHRQAIQSKLESG
jgi:uncharacterized damage-inducible protein DinB